MSSSLRFTRQAARQLAFIPERHRLRLLDRLKRLTDWPNHGQDVRPLKGELEGFYRLRCGGYRALFTVLPGQRSVVVEKIGPRGPAYE